MKQQTDTDTEKHHTCANPRCDRKVEKKGQKCGVCKEWWKRGHDKWIEPEKEEKDDKV